MEKEYTFNQINNVVEAEGKTEITSTAEVNVKQYATAQVVDANLKAENIKQGVTILGIIGTAVNVITASSVDTLPTDAPEGTIAVVG